LTYSIDWGDGTVTNSSSAQHQYSSPGDYEVTGSVGDPYGGGDGVVASVRVCGISNADLCVGEPVRPPDPCDNPTTCGPSNTVDDVVSEVIVTDPCESAQSVCSQVDDALEPARAAAPDVPIGHVKGAGSFTVVTANVEQSSADNKGECHTGAPKACSQERRERAFAKRVKALAIKTTGTDGMSGSVPDIIVLQEVRMLDVKRRQGDHFEGILPALNHQFPGLDWQIAVALGDDNAAEDENASDHRIKDDTAILYASNNITERAMDNNKPDFIQTTYSSSQGCTVAGLDIDEDGFLDCDKPTWKKHAVASFTRLNADGEKTEETIALASVHFVPPSFLAPDSTLANLNPPSSRQGIYKDWAREVALNLQSLFDKDDDHTDGYVLAGDFNAQRCDKKPDDDLQRENVDCEPGGQHQKWWEKLRSKLDEGKGPFLDSVYRKHGTYNRELPPAKRQEARNQAQKELTHQYDDGDHKRDNRIDFIWVKDATQIDGASHDLTCGSPNCDDLNETDRYSDHRLVWSIFHL
jgi:PKD repeat protein